MDARERKPLEWIASALDDIRELPEEIKKEFGHALDEAQAGEKPKNAKPLKGFSGASVLEVRASDRQGTYRAVYTVQFAKAVYVLHVFQKKSKVGIATPKEEIAKVRMRLKDAEQHYKEHYEKE